MSSQGAKCPQFENPDPMLIPVGYKTRISFEGVNLDLYKVKVTQASLEKSSARLKTLVSGLW